MATKAELLASKMWENTADDEPVFMLVGRDALAPHIIRMWVAMHGLISRFDDVLAQQAERKNVEAFNCADAMAVWQRRNGKQIPR
jgi:hypothetical protein